MDKIKEAEQAADSYNVGKEAAKGGTYEQKLNRININHAYKDGYIAGAGKYEALYREAVEALDKMLNAYNSPRLVSYEMIKADTTAQTILDKSKTILND